MPVSVDPAIITALGLDPATATLRPHGGSGFASSYKLTARRLDAGGSGAPLSHYFVKTGSGPDAAAMFRGEHASLNAIAASVPQFCPRAHAHGQMQDRPSVHFLVTDFLELGGPSSGSQAASFASKLAAMHNHEVSPDESGCPEGKPFGFPVPTCCGATEQDNSWKASWADFYANNRLRHVLRAGQKNNNASSSSAHSDKQLADAVARTASIVVPRLLGDGHLQRSGRKGGGPIRPVVIHGDLWSGNKGTGRIVTPSSSAVQNTTSPLVYDPACVYGHAEYELGIMRMFGGFGTGFWAEYTELVPKDEPADEWEDRLVLYELYHHLNHYALFGQGYRGGAMSIMNKLLHKYG